MSTAEVPNPVEGLEPGVSELAEPHLYLVPSALPASSETVLDVDPEEIHPSAKEPSIQTRAHELALHIGKLMPEDKAEVQKAFAEFYFLTKDFASGAIRKYIKNPDLVEDAMSETYMRVFRSMGNFKGNNAQVTSWLYRIAMNAAKDYVVKAQKTADKEQSLDVTEAVEVSSNSADPELSAEAAESGEQLATMIAQLSIKLRQVVVLRGIYGLPYGDIARRLGISEDTAKVRYSRALVKLRGIDDKNKSLQH